MQGFPKLTLTAISLASLGVTNIEHVIDKCKLFFLRRLCIASLKLSVFLTSYIFKHSVSARERGFVSDICRFLQKYSLMYYIEQYISEGYFPPIYIYGDELLIAVSKDFQVINGQRLLLMILNMNVLLLFTMIVRSHWSYGK